MLCQWVNRLNVIYLPVYHPSKKERSDPVLYAKNVRNAMANAGQLQLSELTLSDKRAYHAALREDIKAPKQD